MNFKKVFIPQVRTGIDLQNAETFGELVYMIDDVDYNKQSQKYVDIVRGILVDQFVAGDYLLLVGDPVLIGICFTLMSELSGGAVNCLKWDRQERLYYPINLTELKMEN